MTRDNPVDPAGRHQSDRHSTRTSSHSAPPAELRRRLHMLRWIEWQVDRERREIMRELARQEQ